MRINPREFGWHFFFGFLLFCLLYPIFYAVSNSLKDSVEVYQSTLSLIPPHPTLDSYRYILGRLDYLRIVANTFTVAIFVTAFKLFTSFLAAYALAFLDFKYKNILYFILLSTLFIPFTVTMIPNYMTISQLGLTDTLFGVFLPQLSDALGIFLIRQSMRSIPKPLLEYAYLENSSVKDIIRDIVLPLTKPTIISSGIIFFINSWNEYVWPVLILKSKEYYTLSLALQMYISSEGGTEFNIAMAVATLTMILPIVLFLFFQKYIVNTFANSGIK